MREVHEFVMLSIEAYVILQQHVMSNFLSSLCVCIRKDRHSSVTPKHLLKLSSLSDASQFPMAFILEVVTEQPSNLIDYNPEILCRHFARSAVT